MKSTDTATAPKAPVDVDTQVANCACHLYDAECALHTAHQSGVDTWIAAASDRLHDAVEAYVNALAEQAQHPINESTSRRPLRCPTERNLR